MCVRVSVCVRERETEGDEYLRLYLYVCEGE